MVDSFGHSTTNAALFADFGFDAIFLSREPADSKNKRADDGEFAFVWKPFSKHFGDEKEIFAHFFSSHYFAPDNTLHNDFERAPEDSLQDDPSLQEYNGLKLATRLINHVQSTTRLYAAKKNIIILIGDDFGNMDSFDNFKQIDRVLELCN